MVLSGYISRKF